MFLPPSEFTAMSIMVRRAYRPRVEIFMLSLSLYVLMYKFIKIIFNFYDFILSRFFLFVKSKPKHFTQFRTDNFKKM